MLVEQKGRLIRGVRVHAVDAFRRTLEDPVVRRWMARGRIARTWPLSRAERPGALSDFDGECFEHERIPFVGHPCEWAPEMLAAAGEATLALARALLPRGLQLKDATPANLLFRGPDPVFVDLPSIVARRSGDCLWIARHQFETTFLLPLIASVETGLPVSWSLANPVAGLSHEALARILGVRCWLRPRFWRTVALPAAFGTRAAAQDGAPVAMQMNNDARAQYVLECGYDSLGRQLRRCVDGLAARDSHWQAYTATRVHYGDADVTAKRTFVSSVVADTHPEHTLDIGANTGEFSEIAASQSDVVALDIDERSVASIYRRACEKKLPILPLVGNFGRPTPATGWRNREADSFLARAAGGFDLVLMLAVVHHLRVTEGVPVAEQFEAVAGITRRDLIVEFVPRSDPMFAAIARGRESLYPDCLRPNFELELKRHFRVERSLELPNGRVLYFARLSSLSR